MICGCSSQQMAPCAILVMQVAATTSDYRCNSTCIIHIRSLELPSCIFQIIPGTFEIVPPSKQIRYRADRTLQTRLRTLSQGESAKYHFGGVLYNQQDYFACLKTSHHCNFDLLHRTDCRSFAQKSCKNILLQLNFSKNLIFHQLFTRIRRSCELYSVACDNIKLFTK